MQAPTQTPLQSGDTGPQVKLLQQALVSLGFSVGQRPTAIYGPATQIAVEKFQVAKNSAGGRRRRAGDARRAPAAGWRSQ